MLSDGSLMHLLGLFRADCLLFRSVLQVLYLYVARTVHTAYIACLSRDGFVTINLVLV